MVRDGLARGSLTKAEVPGYVTATLALWASQYCLEFPCTLHHSWAHLLLASGLVPVKRRLVRGLASLLHVPEAPPEQNYKDMRQIMDFVVPVLRRMDNRTLFGTSEKEWAKILSNEGLVKPGLTRIEANIVARHVRFLLGTPADTTRAKPRWRK